MEKEPVLNEINNTSKQQKNKSGILRSSFQTFFKIILITLVFVGGYIFGFKGYVTNLDDPANVVISRDLPPDKQELNFSLFWQVWDSLNDKYYDPDKLNEEDMVYGAIQGMVAGIGDPYTVFLKPRENKVVQEDLKGEFEGVGIQIGYRQSQLTVISPLENSPAEKAGIKAGDFIVRITDEKKGLDINTSGISLPEAVQAIRGEGGSSVKLTLIREGMGEPVEAEVVREAIEVPSISYKFLDSEANEVESGEVGYIRINKFGAETKAEWDLAVIEMLKDQNLRGLLVDVRSNPGGYLQGAAEIAGDFLEVGDVAVREERRGVITQEYKIETLGRLRDQRVAVLVNGGSASASEILSGALRDLKDVSLVGKTTFGKGTIQEPIQLDNGVGLHITIARWLTPSGFWVNDGGLVPDYEVDDSTDTVVDEQLLKAIEVVLN